MQKYNFKELVKLSKEAGNNIIYTQGGGGNTSVKITDSLMAVKASGVRLKDISESAGFVVVDYKKIIDFYNMAVNNPDGGYKEKNSSYIRSLVLDIKGVEKSRPSVEAGFHSILRKYVMHTHSVYANILSCSSNGEETAGEIFKGHDFIFIPYVNPGFDLTLKIMEKTGQYKEKNGILPKIILMQNHGIIINSDSLSGCIDLNKKVNDMIKGYLNIEDDFPVISIKGNGQNLFKSNTKLIREKLNENLINEKLFDKYPLYPDQLVYLNSGAANGTIKIDHENKCINYICSRQKAEIIEETLAAYIYIIEKIKEKGFVINTMPDFGIAFINGWESEKYRQEVSK